MMIRKICRSNFRNNNVIRYFSQLNESSLSKYENSNVVSIDEEANIVASKSVLEPLDEDISHVSSYLKPTFNFAAYINKSETLQELLKLGVDFHKIEKNVEAVPVILGLKFGDIKEHIIFLKNLGLETENIGELISKNPLILTEDLENIKVRLNYLQYKKFTDEMILRIVEVNSYWLTQSTQQIDERLGFFQNCFELSGNEVRQIATKTPKLITYNIDKVKLNIFALKEEMGFSQEELKKMILRKPLILMKEQNRVLKSFEYLHRTMNIPLERIVDIPEILTCRQKRLMERHLFMVKLRKAQYDPKKPNYVGLMTLVSGTDSYFSTEVAKSSVQTYNTFLKSL